MTGTCRCLRTLGGLIDQPRIAVSFVHDIPGLNFAKASAGRNSCTHPRGGGNICFSGREKREVNVYRQAASKSNVSYCTSGPP